MEAELTDAAVEYDPDKWVEVLPSFVVKGDWQCWLNINGARFERMPTEADPESVMPLELASASHQLNVHGYHPSSLCCSYKKGSHRRLLTGENGQGQPIGSLCC